MVQQRRASISRRGLFRLGLGAACAGAALAAAPEAEAVPLSGVSATVNVASLAVRSGPSSANTWIGSLSRGTVVTCTATASAWFRVSAPSVSGWIHSSGVTLRVSSPAVNITRGSLAVKAVCLSFDADVEQGYTASILDTLAAKGVKASFALTGWYAEVQSGLVRRMVNEGHHLLNHSQTHRSFTGLSGGTAPLTPAERLAELIATEQRVVAAAGRTTRPMFRPPYGDYDASVLRDIAAVGFGQHMKWTVDTLGWNGLSRDQIINRVLTNHGNGYIYVLHLGTYSQDGPASAGHHRRPALDGIRLRHAAGDPCRDRLQRRRDGVVRGLTSVGDRRFDRDGDLQGLHLRRERRDPLGQGRIDPAGDRQGVVVRHGHGDTSRCQRAR